MTLGLGHQEEQHVGRGEICFDVSSGWLGPVLLRAYYWGWCLRLWS